MRVRCIQNNFLQLGNPRAVDHIKRYVFRSDGELNIMVGADYLVYGVVFRDNLPWYYLRLDVDDEAPHPYPAALFEVLDGRLSRYWRLATRETPRGEPFSFLVFTEWAENAMFYEDLIEGSPSALATFKRYDSLLVEEFKDGPE